MQNTIDPLGPVEQSWTPGSVLKDVHAGKNLPFWFMPFQIIVVIASLYFSTLAALIANAKIFKPMGLSPGLVWGGIVFFLLFVPAMFILGWLSQRIVNRSVLAIHEDGVRWTRKRVRFDEIESISMGTETFREKHFPTLNAYYKSHWRYGEGVKVAEAIEKRATLEFRMVDGRVVQFRNLGLCFSEETLDAFFKQLGQRLGQLDGGPSK